MSSEGIFATEALRHGECGFMALCAWLPTLFIRGDCREESKLSLLVIDSKIKNFYYPSIINNLKRDSLGTEKKLANH